MLAISSHIAHTPCLAASRPSISRRSTRNTAAFAAHGRRDAKPTTCSDADDVAPSRPPGLIATSSAALLALGLTAVDPSHASEPLAALTAFSPDGDVIDRVRDTLTSLENAPKFQTVPLWLAVMVASELLPLFPSQPAALTSGIVFGAVEGAAMVLFANTAAATLAFFAARGAGRAAAENIIIAADVIDDESTGGNAFQRKWTEFQSKLANADPLTQTSLIALYRLTPHPFSASNYLFGLTKVKIAPYIVGTGIGVAPYAALYACIGAYGRTLLDSGEAVDKVFEDLGVVVGRDVEMGEEGLLAAGLFVLVACGVRRLMTTTQPSDSV